MPYKSLSDFVKTLESENELIRIKEYVNPYLEMTDIVDRLTKSGDGKAVLFENTGTPFPVLMNAFGSEKRISLALGNKSLSKIGYDIENLFKKLTQPKSGFFDKIRILPDLGRIASWMPKKIRGRGKCQEVIIDNPDLSQLPVLTCWPFDGGPFITLPCVHTKDLETGNRNVGMYRMQIFEKQLTGMHWHKHKTGARHYNEYKKAGKKMPVVVTLGGDPAYTYSATAPLPDNIDEYLLAGFLRKKRVEMVRCITQDMEVPADVDFVIEGYVDPNEDLIWEGPFGDHTGFYSLADWYPRFHVTCITHRKNAVYPATIVGVPPMEDAWIGKATERIFLAPIKLAILPEIIDYNLPFQGVAHNIVIVKIEKSYAGQAQKVMNALWGAGQMMFNKIMIVVDQNVDIDDYNKLLKVIGDNTNPEQDILFTYGPLDVLDHSSSKFAYGSKMGIDATTKFEEEKNQKIVKVHKRNLAITDELIKGHTNIHNAFIEPHSNILFISVVKESTGQIGEIITQLSKSECLNEIKACIIFEHMVDIYDLNLVTWIGSGNIDPKRDSVLIPSTETSVSKIFIDATRKSKIKGQFERDWPNVVVMDINTIETIDKNWDKYGLGKFIPSPSLKYRKLNQSEGDKVVEH